MAAAILLLLLSPPPAACFLFVVCARAAAEAGLWGCRPPDLFRTADRAVDISDDGAVGRSCVGILILFVKASVHVMEAAMTAAVVKAINKTPDDGQMEEIVAGSDALRILHLRLFVVFSSFMITAAARR